MSLYCLNITCVKNLKCDRNYNIQMNLEDYILWLNVTFEHYNNAKTERL